MQIEALWAHRQDRRTHVPAREPLRIEGFLENGLGRAEAPGEIRLEPFPNGTPFPGEQMPRRRQIAAPHGLEDPGMVAAQNATSAHHAVETMVLDQ